MFLQDPRAFLLQHRDRALAFLDELPHARKRPHKPHGAPSFFLCEIPVAAAHRKAIRLAHGGRAKDVHRDTQVLHHAADEHELLPVLLAEDGEIRLHHVEEDRHDREHPRKVPGPRRPAKAIGHRAGMHAHERLACGIERFRHPDEIHARVAAGGDVLFRCARIGGEVLVRPELDRIHINAHDDTCGLFFGAADER